MQIVIEINNERYKDIQRIAEVQMQRRMSTIEQIIANGTALPKGHGRLIDADELIGEFENVCAGECGCCGRVNNCPVFTQQTIIEADKAGEEE